ncbi:MAG: FecR domain-containing protein [Bryobacteraceae bacterium]
MNPESNELDRAIEAIRNEEVDPAAVEAAAGRVWNRIQHATLCGCEDFRALFADFKAGRLAEARALLVRDHLNECVACRKLYEARPKAAEMPARRFHPWLRWAMAAAAALVVGVGLWSAWPYLVTGGPSVLQSANGTVYQVSGGALQRVTTGAEIPGASEIRTAGDSGAVVRLGDGSQVEMRERSAFYVTGGGRDLTVHLGRGSIIVQAAKRRAGHLYVATRDCRVAVTGTVFSVNSGAKGSRVSVIEGSVRVQQGSQEESLKPGEQYVSDPSLTRVPVPDEIAWSRNVEQHLALLREFSALGKNLEQVRLPDLRYGSRLMGLLPADTVLYIAIPNLARSFAEAEQIIQQRAQESPVLRQWWEERGARAAIERLRDLGEYIGDEVVIALTARQGRKGAPVFLADVKRPGFREYLEHEVQKLGGGREHFRVVEDPSTAAPGRGLLVYLRSDLAAFSPDAAALAAVAQSSGGFASTGLGRRVQQLYANGAGLVFAADLETMTGLRPPSSHRHEPPGFANLKYVVADHKETGARNETHAVLGFSGPRTGIAAWLAKPAPIAALDYIGPDAAFASAFLVKSPAAMFQELAGSRDTHNELGLDPVNDIFGPLGGEIAMALDGPALPVPSWKLVVEVNDPARLEYAIGRVAEAYNRHASTAGKPPVRLTQETAAGQVWRRIEMPDFAPYGEAWYTFSNGYLVAAPSRALLERALQYRATGTGLARSAKFASMLPRDGYTDFSGMVYQNAGTALAPLFDAFSRATPGQRQQLESLSAQLAGPTLITLYGENDRIAMAGSGLPFGISPAGMLRMAGAAMMPRLRK